ncbi:MAG: hypothetical protein HY744_00810 [Deltaproteobacteria bacterium]|nr:hypothetical protein [Deltaproteobacteria bacterium]
MTGRRFLLGAVLFGSAVALGCGHPEEDSCNIKTAGIYVEYEVAEQGAQATAKATFWVGDDSGGTYLTLGQCGDQIQVNGKALDKKAGNPEYYESALASADGYEFVFTRVDEDPYPSSVAPPADVSISAPAADASISRADPFDITWDKDGSGEIKLLVEGDCIASYPKPLGDEIADTGSYTVNAGDIEPFVESDKDKTCSATITLTREKAGSLHQSLKGTMKATTTASRGFESKP